MDINYETQGELCIMNHTGDTKLVWDRANTPEVDNAKRTFTDLRAKGYLAYKVKKDGEKAEQIHEFDPAAERIIPAPPMDGG